MINGPLVRGLTDLDVRQQMMVRLLGMGLSNKEIGTAMHLTEGTVKVYGVRLINRVRHLGLDNRFKLGLWGLEQDGFLTRGAESPAHLT